MEGSEERLVLDGVELEGADFSGRRLADLGVSGGCRLVRCDFRRTRITGGCLGASYETSTYEECLFDGASLRHVSPGRATFVGCSFRDVKIHDFFCLETQFVDCVFTGRLKKVVFDARPPSGAERLGRDRNEYRGNDFSGAQLVDVGFRGGIDLDQQRLPDGPEYLVIRDARVVLKFALDEVRAWPEDKEQSRTLTKLEVLWSEGGGGQRDLFVERAFLGKTPESADRLAAILTRLSGHARAGRGGP